MNPLIALLWLSLPEGMPQDAGAQSPGPGAPALLDQAPGAIASKSPRPEAVRQRGNPNEGAFLTAYGSARVAGIEFSHFFNTHSEYPAALSIGVFRWREGHRMDAMVFRDGGAFFETFYLFGGFGVRAGQATGIGLTSRVRAGVFRRAWSAGLYAEGSLGTRHSLGSVGLQAGVHF